MTAALDELTVGVTGATGFVGRHLCARLRQPIILARRRSTIGSDAQNGSVRRWDPNGPPDPAAVEGLDVLFHLAGEPIAAARWTAKRKQRIRDSRIDGTRNLVGAIAAAKHKPRVLVCASAVGYYGSRGDLELDEQSPPGNDFLADVCRAWEAEALAARELGVRVVCVRLGVVLGSGGALARMLPPFKMGIGGPLGDGRHWMAWIHLNDAVGILLHAASDDQLSGPVNAVAPNPVTNAKFTRALGRAVRRPTLVRTPKSALRLLFGELAETALLASQRVRPMAALRAGYEFEFATLDEALASVVH